MCTFGTENYLEGATCVAAIDDKSDRRDNFSYSMVCKA